MASAETQEIMPENNALARAVQTGIIMEMYQTQRDAAQYLELGMLKLWNHPKIAKDVRQAAAKAQILHRTTAGLMTNFTSTSQLVVKKIIPIILMGVEKEDSEIIKAALNKIIDFASDMQKETTVAINGYNTVVLTVNGSIGEIEEENKSIQTTTKENQLAIELEKGRRKETVLSEMELDKEISEKRKELKEVENERKEARTQMVRAAMSIGETDGKKFLSETMRPTALTGNVGAVVGVIESGLNLANDIFQFVKKGSQFAAMDKAQAKIEKDNEQQFKQLQEMKRERQEKREQKLQQIHKIKTLTLQIEAGVGDMENLREAVLHLGKVQRLLGEISAFWGTMLDVVKFLQKNDEGNDLHILTMKYDPTDITNAIQESKQYWTVFGSICHGYARESTKEIGPLYSFLERPLDELTPGERMEKTKQLIQSIEEDIDKTYPANEGSQ